MTLNTENVYTACEAEIMDDCTSGEILRSVVLSLYNGYRYPIPLHRLGILGYGRYGIAVLLVNHYHQNGECAEMHALAKKITETYPEEVHQLNARKPHDTKDLREALAFYDAEQADPEGGLTGARRDAREWLMNAVRGLLQQDTKVS